MPDSGNVYDLLRPYRDGETEYSYRHMIEIRESIDLSTVLRRLLAHLVLVMTLTPASRSDRSSSLETAANGKRYVPGMFSVFVARSSSIARQKKRSQEAKFFEGVALN